MRSNKTNNRLVRLNRPRPKVADPPEDPPARPVTIDFLARDRYSDMHRVKRQCGLHSLTDLPLRVIWAFRARRLMRVG